MLSDPISITYDGSPKSMPRSSGSPLSRSMPVGTTYYGNLASGLLMRISQSRMQWNFPRPLDKVEFTLFEQTEETDYPNGAGLVFYSDPFRENTSTTIPLLDAAVRTFVDSTIRSRLVNGEL